MASFNPYQVWLELNGSVISPSYFQLLGLDEAEDDTRTIAAAADRAASRVRRCRPGEHATEWAALLDEIAEAKKCLTNPESRRQYLRTLSQKSDTAAVRIASPSSTASGPRPAVDPNMYPPGLAPAMGPIAVAQPLKSEGTDDVPFQQMPQFDSTPPIPPRADLQPAANPFVPVPSLDAMQPYTTDVELPMSPAGVPYLQPADPSGLPDPMHPALPPMGNGMFAHLPSPMAPAAIPFSGPMAPVFGSGYPMAAVPLGPPISDAAIPMAQPLPFGSTVYPMGTPIPAASVPANNQFAAAPVTVSNSAAILSRHNHSSFSGPILLGVSAGMLMLAAVGGYFYLNAQHKSLNNDEIAENAPRDIESNPEARSGDVPASSPYSANDSANSPRVTAVPPATELDTGDSKLSSPETKSPESKAPSEPALSSPPARVMEKTSAEMPKPMPPSSPDPKAMPAPTTTPKPESPVPADEVPKPTKEELAKLGRAMTKAREAIGEHEFDRAEAFLSVASEMPRLPQHQAMLDRLRLLSENVSAYRKAIQDSIAKLSGGSSFKVGESMVGVVETGPEKVIFRVNGQNRSYPIRDLPAGLAAALAAQSLSEDDPAALAQKGAYVVASPRATSDELKKAREFLEKASGSVDAAKDLLLLFDDKYDLASSADKK